MGRRTKNDCSGLEIKRETEGEFLRRIEHECRTYEKKRKKQLIYQQLLGKRN